MWKWIRKGMLGLLAFVMIVMAVGYVYQRVGLRQDRKAYQPVGKLYEISGHKMHLYTAGEGDTTVVMASGWGTSSPYASFYPLYAGLVSHTKIAVYDRFGYGFSDVSGIPRNVNTITDEMHELFQKSELKPPYILVGHSLGSLEVIRYAQRFPDEVKAILLEEGGSPEFYSTNPEMIYVSTIANVLRQVGVARLLTHTSTFLKGTAPGVPETIKEMDRMAVAAKLGNRDMADERRQMNKNAAIVLEAKKTLSIPLIVLTADGFGKLNMDSAWRDSQAVLPAWSTLGKQIIVKDADHYIHNFQPDFMVSEILKLVER
ncbi:alpha/beta hydrolase [Paenibacillus aurantius]|uniref:Alpha/beta hydrolase n=1 Tax=Paenibacillus aurantius TaxID=2918900 RepID=A0AA96LFW0_9BACL|nr:alpha/beta hydrolase [Paenibacillus aurantius]WNQ12518.1 alpha/beta hydrolase [Paenibacillus aurantius]